MDQLIVYEFLHGPNGSEQDFKQLIKPSVMNVIWASNLDR